MKLKRWLLPLLLFLATGLVIVSLRGGTVTEPAAPLASLTQVSPVAWEQLAQQKILFGHQSVGGNILQGVEDLAQEHRQIRLAIVEQAKPASLQQPGLTHFLVGHNGVPNSKISHFASVVEAAAPGAPDVAFFELCFVDITGQTDVAKMFADYKATLTRLQTEFPKTMFIPMTVALTAEPDGQLRHLMRQAKYWVKRGVPDNLKREEFNQRLRQEWAGKTPIFDLAQIESTTPEGTRRIHTMNGQRYPSLVPAYSDDSAHLNAKGRKLVAAQLLVLLSQIASPA